MNILPKKSWHVRNKDNVARVRRDEAAAEVERRKREARALRAEQEVRTEVLRKRARLGGRSPAPPALFPPPEEAAPNREHEAEKRRERERRERALGVLTYLGQSAAEAQTCPPWYLQPPKIPGQGSREVQGGRKALLDPLQEMRKGLRRAPSPKKPQNPPEPRPGSPPGAPRGGAGLAELRRQRLAREAAEAARSRELLGGPRDPRNPPGTPRNPARDPRNPARDPRNPPGTPQNPAWDPPPERQRRYNSQFHPRLARGTRNTPKFS
uniref:leukocyte receptor cluster member 1 homolog n=1 Tax=Lonchura striata TaxID=40157 RepID=UPI0012933251|nr:leukocyte receptor cluster member 1 homolog [Lonchura striata domestica]